MPAQPPAYDPLQPVPASGSSDPGALRSAAWLWIVGGLEMLSITCCLLGFAVILVVPASEFVGQGMSATQAQQLNTLKPVLPLIMLGIMLLGFVPGLCYVILAFLVRRGRHRPTLVCRGLLLTQAILLGLMLLNILLGALAQANPWALVLGCFMLGLPLALLIYVFHLTGQTPTRTALADSDSQTDPWRHE